MKHARIKMKIDKKMKFITTYLLFCCNLSSGSSKFTPRCLKSKSRHRYIALTFYHFPVLFLLVVWSLLEMRSRACVLFFSFSLTNRKCNISHLRFVTLTKHKFDISHLGLVMQKLALLKLLLWIHCFLRCIY